MWLCAVHRREQGSDDDAYAWFASLHGTGRLLPSKDDSLRDRAEAVIRLQRGLTAELLRLVQDALSSLGTELVVELGGYLPCRVLVGGDAAGEHQPGALDALLDGFGVPGGIFLDGAIDDLGLGNIGERGEVADRGRLCDRLGSANR